MTGAAMQLSTVDLGWLRWRKSTRSGGASGDNCVEFAFTGPVVAVRDSKNPATDPLTFPTHDWSTFLDELAR
jgi:hypothetical protein